MHGTRRRTLAFRRCSQRSPTSRRNSRRLPSRSAPFQTLLSLWERSCDRLQGVDGVLLPPQNGTGEPPTLGDQPGLQDGKLEDILQQLTAISTKVWLLRETRDLISRSGSGETLHWLS